MRHALRLLPAAAVIAGAAVLGGFGAAAVHAANPPTCPLGLVSAGETTPSDGGHTFEVCAGTGTHRVRTFDGTPLETDVTLPEVPYYPPGSATPATPPLMIFMSGWSNDYCQFMSTSLAGTAISGCGDFIGNAGYHWNNAWFASQGWVVVDYTPRGWYASCGNDLSNGYSFATDSECNDTSGEESWVHLYDRRYEVRDAQYLAGLLVDTGLVNPQQIVVSGDSGGGGPSWDLALSQDSVVQLSSTPTDVVTSPWVSPVHHTPMHLAAALPMYTWTDLVDSLMPNGRASDAYNGAPADQSHTSPVGVEKQSYVTGLFAKGVSNVPTQFYQTAQYAKPCPAVGCDATADLSTWFLDINAGEPTFQANPQTPTIIAQVGGPLRSPLAIPVPPKAHEIPIFSIQGLTDPLFPADQTLMMINRLKAADPAYPVWAFFGDVGHSYADNPLDVWQRAHNEGNAWLSQVLAGTAPTAAPVTLDTTRCVSGQSLVSYTAASFAAIATQKLTFTSTAAQANQTTVNANVPTSEGVDTDPIVNSGCRSVSSGSASPSSEAVYSFPIASPVTLAGGPYVHVDVSVNNATSAEIAARLWDVDPSGNETLMSRTVYRLAGSALQDTQSLAFELWPNAWQLQAGHTVKLELTQDDVPMFRADNEPSNITYASLTLTLPVVAGEPSTGVPESPFTPLLPGAAFLGIAGAALVARRRIRVR